MTAIDRKPIFDAAKQLGARFRSSVEVAIMDRAIDRALGLKVPLRRRISSGMFDKMKGFEGLRLAAYPDPGSKDGKPWTIGYGATGPDIGPGTVWTQGQAEDRFARDLAHFEDGVDKLLDGAPTTQAQFDALVSIAYNIGLDDDADDIAEGLGDSTLLRLHKQGEYERAAAEFRKWIYNDGKPMRGLQKRRAIEAAHYQGHGL